MLSLTECSHPDIKVEDGATLCGMLDRRGCITRNLRNKVPFAEWDVQDILAMFCSGIDRNHSFDKAYKQTRGRLFHGLYLRVRTHIKQTNDDNILLIAYTLGAMEYDTEFKSLGEHLDPRQPTCHMLRFAELFKQESEQFYLVNDRQNDRKRKQVAEYLAKLIDTPQWAQITSNADVIANFKFMFDKGVD